MGKTLTAFTIDRPCLEQARRLFIKPEDWEARKDSLPAHSMRSWFFSGKGFDWIPHMGLRHELDKQALAHGLRDPKLRSQLLKTGSENELLVYFRLTHEPGWIFWFLHLATTLLFSILLGDEEGVEMERTIPLWIRVKEEGGKTTVSIEENYLYRRAMGGCCLFLFLSLFLIIPGVAYFLIRCLDRQATKRFAREVLAPTLEARLREDDTLD